MRERQSGVPLSVRILLLLAAIGCIILFLVMNGGIPRIDHGISPQMKEAAAARIQILELLLLVPAVFMLAIALSRIYAAPPVRDPGRFLLSMPSSAFMILVVVLAVAGSAAMSVIYLERSPQIVDAQNYFFQARIFESGHLWVPSRPAMQEFFNFIGIMDTEGRRYASSFPGHPFFLFLGLLVKLPWLVNPLHGSFIVLFLYLLGRHVAGEETGRLAALLGLVSPFRLFQCSLFMAHPTTTLWILVFLFVLLRYFDDRRFWQVVVIGVAGGILYLVRPQSAVPILFPFGIVYLVFLFQRRIHLWHIPIIALLLASAIAFGGWYNTQLTGDWTVSPRDIVAPSLRPGFGDDVGRPLGHGKFSGHSIANGVKNTVENMKLFGRESLCWGGWSFLLLIPALFSRPRHWFFAVSAISGIILVILFFTYPINSPLFGPRYYFEWLPLYLLLLARGFIVVRSWLRERENRSMFFCYAASIRLAVVLPLLTVTMAVFILPSQIDRYYQDIKPNRLGKAVSSAKLSNALIFVRGDYFDYSYSFIMNDPACKGDVLYAADRGPGRNILLMHQYPGRGYFLFDQGSLNPLDGEFPDNGKP